MADKDLEQDARGDDGEDFDGFTFTAMTTCTMHIHRVLKAIRPKKAKSTKQHLADQYDSSNLDQNVFVIVTITNHGLAFSVGEMHTGLGRLYIDRSLFSNYSFSHGSDENVSFRLSLDRFITCLQMFASNEISSAAPNDKSKGTFSGKGNLPTHTCRMVYQGEGYPFLLIFRQGASLITTCEFKTLTMEEETDGTEEALRLDLANIVQQVIIPGKIMAEAIGELKTIETVTLTIRASNTAPRFALISHGKMGVSQFAFPNEKRVLELFHIQDGTVDEEGQPLSSKDLTVVNSYNFDQIMKAYEAINLASRVSLRCDVNGFMSLQSMYEVGDGRSIFIDFRFGAIEEDEFQTILDQMGF